MLLQYHDMQVTSEEIAKFPQREIQRPLMKEQYYKALQVSTEKKANQELYSLISKCINFSEITIADIICSNNDIDLKDLTLNLKYTQRYLEKFCSGALSATSMKWDDFINVYKTYSEELKKPLSSAKIEKLKLIGVFLLSIITIPFLFTKLASN